MANVKILVGDVPIALKKAITELSNVPVRLFPLSDLPVMTHRCVSG